MSLINQLKKRESSLLSKLKGGFVNTTSQFSKNVLEPGSKPFEFLIRGVNSQFDDIMGLEGREGGAVPTPSQFGQKLVKGSYNTVKDIAKFGAELPAQFGADVYAGAKGLLGGGKTEGYGMFRPKLDVTKEEQNLARSLAAQAGLPQEAQEVIAINAPFLMDVLRAYTISGFSQAVGKVGVGLSPKPVVKPELAKGELTPELLESFKRNASLQVGGQIKEKIGEANARYWSNVINNANYSKAKNVADVERIALNELNRHGVVPRIQRETVEESIKNWAKSAEQIRFNALEMAKDPVVMSQVKDLVKPNSINVAPVAPISAVAKEALPIYGGSRNLSTNILRQLEGKSSVSRQFISDLTNQGNIKQAERDVIRNVLDSYPEGNIPVKDFATKVKGELLPLKIKSSDRYIPDESGFHNPDKMVEEGNFTPKYENISLPREIRGEVGNYRENLYESSIPTSAGDVHFQYESPNYFGHTRVEDMADNKVRRVIEVQSDLYQKGNLEREAMQYKATPIDSTSNELMAEKFGNTKVQPQGTRGSELAKLQQYNDPTAHFRMVREEVKQAAKDGKTKLQFPTGETAMKIEGLGDSGRFYHAGNGSQVAQSQLKQGLEVTMDTAIDGDTNGSWIITDVLGDGKFKAVPRGVSDTHKAWKTVKDTYTPPSNQRYIATNSQTKEVITFKTPKEADNYIAELIKRNNEQYSETFDISGKIDTSNPIYRFYEKEVGRYLSNKYGAKKITDAQGVEWWELPVKKEYGRAPVEAFGAVPLILPINKNE